MYFNINIVKWFFILDDLGPHVLVTVEQNIVNIMLQNCFLCFVTVNMENNYYFGPMRLVLPLHLTSSQHFLHLSFAVYLSSSK